MSIVASEGTMEVVEEEEVQTTIMILHHHTQDVLKVPIAKRNRGSVVSSNPVNSGGQVSGLVQQLEQPLDMPWEAEEVASNNKHKQVHRIGSAGHPILDLVVAMSHHPHEHRTQRRAQLDMRALASEAHVEDEVLYFLVECHSFVRI